MFDDTTQVDAQPTVTDNQQAPEVTESKAEAPSSLREYNLRTLRERAEAAERRAKDLENQINQSKSQDHRQLEPRQQQASNQSDTEDMTIGDEELIEGKHLKKYVNSITQKYDRQMQEMMKQSALDNAERSVKAKYSDFESVVTEDNLNNFKALYPEEFSSLMANPDPYARFKTAYTNILNFGIAERKQATREVDRRLEDNRNKPRSSAGTPSSTSDTPLSRVSEFDRRVLTEEMKDQMRRNLAVAKDALKYSRREQ